MDMTLIKNADILSSEKKGINDILIAGGKIQKIGRHLESYEGCVVIDADGRLTVPGLVDGHVHLTGGGGEDGCLSRVPPLSERKIVEAGVTSVVGLLGTDGYTRTVRDLVAKTKAVKEYGLSAWCLTGSYQLPSPTITGSIGDDVMFIDEIIGVKVAIGDHRCSMPEKNELLRMAANVRMASLMSKKCGITHIHAGTDERALETLFEIASTTTFPIRHFYPTHMGPHPEISKKWLEMGGHIDLTCQKGKEDQIINLLGLKDDQISLSTDSNGSFPIWNEKREIIGMKAGSIKNLLETVFALIDLGVEKETAFSLATKNPAKALMLKGKGELKEGYDADVLILDGRNVDILFAGGVVMKNGPYVKQGMYEDCL